MPSALQSTWDIAYLIFMSPYEKILRSVNIWGKFCTDRPWNLSKVRQKVLDGSGVQIHTVWFTIVNNLELELWSVAKLALFYVCLYVHVNTFLQCDLDLILCPCRSGVYFSTLGIWLWLWDWLWPIGCYHTWARKRLGYIHWQLLSLAALEHPRATACQQAWSSLLAYEQEVPTYLHSPCW